jgi:hypothetical protein
METFDENEFGPAGCFPLLMQLSLDAFRTQPISSSRLANDPQ